MGYYEFEELVPFLRHIAKPFTQQNPTLQVDKLVNEVWLAGGLTKIPKSKPITLVGYIAKKDMIDYMRSKFKTRRYIRSDERKKKKEDGELKGLPPLPRFIPISEMTSPKTNDYSEPCGIDFKDNSPTHVELIDSKEIVDIITSTPALGRTHRLILKMMIHGYLLDEIAQVVGCGAPNISLARQRTIELTHHYYEHKKEELLFGVV